MRQGKLVLATSLDRYRRSPRAKAFSVRSSGVIYAFMLLVAVLTLATSLQGRVSYLDPVNLSNILDQSSLVAFLAVFTTLVLLSGNFDLSIGSVAALSGCVALTVIDRWGVGPAVAAALATGLGAGLINGFLVQIVGINAFIVTLGTLTAFRGMVLILTGATTVSANSTALSALENGQYTIPNVVLVGGVGFAAAAVFITLTRRHAQQALLSSAAVGLALVGVGGIAIGAAGSYPWTLTYPTFYALGLTVLAWTVLRYTVPGRRLYAVGGNSEAARLSGINVNGYKITAFALNGLAAAFVGVLYAAKLGAVNPEALQGTELTVLAAAILGGTSLFGGSGSVVKSVVGVLILFTLANGFNILNLGANYQGLIQGVVIVLAAATYTLAGRRPALLSRAAVGSPGGEELSPPGDGIAARPEVASRVG